MLHRKDKQLDTFNNTRLDKGLGSIRFVIYKSMHHNTLHSVETVSGISSDSEDTGA